MTKEEFAARLHGREYRKEMSRADDTLAMNEGLVVVFGASDDLVEFRGAIDEELYCHENLAANLFLTNGSQGKPIWIAATEQDTQNYIPTPFPPIVAQWAPAEPDCSWLITSDIPHATFDILEDGELFCRGIVFSLVELVGQ